MSSETQALLVQKEKTQLLYRALWAAVAINILLFAIDAAFFYYEGLPDYFTPWCAFFVLLTLYRVVIGIGYKKHYDRYDDLTWAKLYALGAAAVGVFWGASLFILVWDAPTTHVTLQTITVVSVVSGGASITAAYRPAAFALIGFTIPVTGVFYFMQDGGLHDQVIGTLAMIYALVMLAFINNFHKILTESLEKRIENEDLARNLERAVLVSDKARKAQSDFIVNVSHEIRTPMTGLMGTIDLAQNSTHKEERDNYLSIAQKSGKALVSLINDILDMAKLESDQFSLQLAPANINQVAEQSIVIMTALSEEKGLDLRLTTDCVEDEWVSLDAARLTQVLINLIVNAVKFTEQGSVTLDLKTAYSDRNPRKLDIEFSVIDTGVGIKKEKLPDLFNRFVQIDGGRNRTQGGTGLGLAICKEIIEYAGGTIDVQSEFGKGTTFKFAFTSRICDPVENEEKSVDEVIVEQADIKALVVDDNPVNRMIMDKMLSPHGIDVTLAESGQQAIDIMKDRQDCQVILMDIQMPEMDGMTAMKAIRALSDDYKNLPILAVTANSHGDAEMEYKKKGFDGYVSKPLDQDILIETIKSAVKLA